MSNFERLKPYIEVWFSATQNTNGKNFLGWLTYKSPYISKYWLDIIHLSQQLIDEADIEQQGP